MSVPSGPTAERSMAAFRRRIDTFFGDPRTAGLAADLPSLSPRAPTTAASALRGRLDDVLSRLGIEPAGGTLRLRKSVTMHEGTVVALTGDATPLGAAQDVRVVTTTTTVLDGGRMRTETTVLVFERRADQ
jgi:hypothetical protein